MRAVVLVLLVGLSLNELVGSQPPATKTAEGVSTTSKVGLLPETTTAGAVIAPAGVSSGHPVIVTSQSQLRPSPVFKSMSQQQGGTYPTYSSSRIQEQSGSIPSYRRMTEQKGAYPAYSGTAEQQGGAYTAYRNQPYQQQQQQQQQLSQYYYSAPTVNPPLAENGQHDGGYGGYPMMPGRSFNYDSYGSMNPQSSSMQDYYNLGYNAWPGMKPSIYDQQQFDWTKYQTNMNKIGDNGISDTNYWDGMTQGMTPGGRDIRAMSISQPSNSFTIRDATVGFDAAAGLLAPTKRHAKHVHSQHAHLQHVRKHHHNIPHNNPTPKTVCEKPQQEQARVKPIIPERTRAPLIITEQPPQPKKSFKDTILSFFG